jgi:hypothetical protein
MCLDSWPNGTGYQSDPTMPMTAVDHIVTILQQGQMHGIVFRKRFKLAYPPTNGLRVSLGERDSFVVEDLIFHLDTETFSCRTSIEVGDDPFDDVLSYYSETGYRVVHQ